MVVVVYLSCFHKIIYRHWLKIVARWANESTAIKVSRIRISVGPGFNSMPPELTKASFLTRGSSYYQTAWTKILDSNYISSQKTSTLLDRIFV